MRGSRNIRQVGGGWVQLHLAYKKGSDNFFFYFYFSLVPNLFYRSALVTFKENYHLPRFQFGWNIFQGGVQLFTGGPIAFSLKKPSDFPRGSGPPEPPPPTPSGSAHVVPCIVIYLSTRFSLFFFNITLANSFVERGGNVASAAVLLG